MMIKTNLILADCKMEEIESFKDSLQKELNTSFEIVSKVCNGKRTILKNIYRYLVYMFFPLKIFFNRKKYNYIVGWQQFFALFYVFYAKLFHIKKQNKVIAVNFTYKSKKGGIGKVYKKVMTFILDNKYLDYIHVPSENYAKDIAEQFNIPIEKFIVIPFGIPDKSELWKDAKCEYSDYSLAIGRSNRDYDFLVELWKDFPTNEKLVIICDEYKPKDKLPENIILRKDITGDLQFPYLKNAKLIIIPIKEENICSGDTVLLESMSFGKPIAITVPSTLGEMYLREGKNGIGIPRLKNEAKDILINLLKDKEKLDELSLNSRMCFEENYSRYSMGKNLANVIKSRS